ncbi:TatD family hydrolase [Paraferrimonas sedimenticola]|uniref:DNAse n=1 Tax=Paraferrimonas sedimenticola TaxID=375674 RepID=A0AA37W2N8_9GAMM|nr:TatD family hydrolase [Paraferrimonas sedimenticola]GLP98082.1 DNAse [Paraferrimonas sedimenticola]
MFVDSHCHLNRLKNAPDRDSVAKLLEGARSRGVNHFLCVSVCQSEFESMKDMVAGLEGVSLSAGVHPLDVDDGLDIELLRQQASAANVVAIGETGLDYYYSKDSKDTQQEYFTAQIGLAVELDKPVIVHTRDAREDTIQLLKDGGVEQCGGVLHCFTENWEMAKAALDLGMYISMSGIVSFKNAKELQAVAKQIPLDRLLIETDSPYLAPVPHRGKENQPAFVADLAQFLADLRGERLEALAQQTTANYFNLFKLAAN